MNGISTLTQKGQVVIPEVIRTYFNMKPSSKLSFEVVGQTIVARPIMTTDEALGMIKAKSKISKMAIKQAVSEAIADKFASKKL